MITLDGGRIPYRDAISVTVVSPTGEMAVIADHRPRRGHQPVMLLKDGFTGGDGAVEYETAQSVTRYGVRRSGFKIPEIKGGFKVLVTDDEEDLSVAFRRWRAMWSRTRPSKIKVEWRDGHTSEIEAVLVDAAPLPHSMVGQHTVEDEVSWRSFRGVWTGATRYYTGAFDIAVPGDLPPSLKLKWTGAPTSFTLPGGLTMSLGQGPGARWINLDRGMQGQVTDATGAVDSGTWSSLRGRLAGETLSPHQKYSFKLGTSLTLEVTPRFLSPWR